MSRMILRSVLVVAALNLSLSQVYADGFSTVAGGFSPSSYLNQALTSGANSTVTLTGLPATSALIQIDNTGAFPVNAAMGGSGVAATATTGQSIPAGGGCLIAPKGNGFVGLFPVGGNSTVQISIGTGLGEGCWGGGSSSGGSSGNVSVVAVPADASVAGSSPITAADTGGSSSSTTGAGGLIWTGAPLSASVETFSLNTYQGALISARGTFTNTTTLVIEGTMDSASAQTAGTAKWVQEPVVLPGQSTSASSFTAPFEQAALTAAGLQGVRCRVPSGQYTTSDSITCTVRTTLAQPASILQGVNAAHPLFAQGNVIQAGVSIPINISTATTQTLVAAVSGKAIYVTAWDVIAAGTTTLTFEYGTGTGCVGGTTALTGPYGLVAQFGATKGSGLGPVLVVPAGNALCAVNSATVQVSGSLSFLQS